MTKEEIFCKHLGEYVPCELKNVVLTYVETQTILSAVQEFADQEKQALKEKVKKLLRFEPAMRLVMSNQLQSPDNFLKALDELKKEIE